jgi:hypothetical protein
MMLRKWVARKQYEEAYSAAYEKEKQRWYGTTLTFKRYAPLKPNSEAYAAAYAQAVVTDEWWIKNLRKGLNQNMFSRIKNWFGKEKAQMRGDLNNLYAHYQNLSKAFDEKLEELYEELHIHKKLTASPETKLVRNPARNPWDNAKSVFNHAAEGAFQEARNEAAKEGFVYFHTKTNGDEVWKKKDLA